MVSLRRQLRTLRIRVPATAMAVFAISLAVAAVLAYELFLQDGRNDANIVMSRETERFELSIAGLLDDIREDEPDLGAEDSLRAAVTRYLQLNPSTESYWTIVHFADGETLAAYNGPPELEPLYERGELPQGPLNERRTIETAAGDVRTSSVPVMLGDEQLATLQVVTPMEPVRLEAREAAWLVVAAAGISLILGGILLTASLWRSLAPLGDLANAARSTELLSLSARVEQPDTDDEVGLLAREFNTMLERLEAASAGQREFMASIGHELRTPITIARGHLETLESVDRADPDALVETVAIVQDELSRMGRLVEDLMAIARSGMEDFVRPRELELVQWFEDLDLKLTGTAEPSEIVIEPPPPITLHADPDRLAQAVLNLINNARTHTPQGTRVRIAATCTEGAVEIAVIDDGQGIPEAIREEVFSPFVRGDAPSSTGLGLSVVKAVAEAHDGEVVLTTGTQGTRIGLRLPWASEPDGDHGDDPTVNIDHDLPRISTDTAPLPHPDPDGSRPTSPMTRP